MNSALGTQYIENRNPIRGQSQVCDPPKKDKGSKGPVQEQTLSKKANGSNVMSLLGSITNKLRKNPLTYLLLATQLGQVSAQESPQLDYMDKCGWRYPNSLSEQDTTLLKNLETAFNNDEDPWQFYKIYNEAKKSRYNDEMSPEVQRTVDAGKSYEALLSNQDTDVLSEKTEENIKKLWENNDDLKEIFPTIEDATDGMVERIKMNKEQRLRFSDCHEL